MADTQTFQNIDAAKWARIEAAVKAKGGITISNNDGEASAKGVDIKWDYLPDALSLTVTLVSRRFFDPSSAEIDTDLATWVAAA